MRMFFCFFLLYAPLIADEFVIGSKRFTESYILGEILKLKATEIKEVSVKHKKGLGNTAIVFNALKEGLIDVYPEYTGTIQSEILKIPLENKLSFATLQEEVAKEGLVMSEPLGFNNGYALAMKRNKAQELGIKTLSDLKKHPALACGFSNEFLGRRDGCIGLKEAYDLTFSSVKGIDHALSYNALINGIIDVTDIYTTDPKIAKYDLLILEDDKHFFPKYEAVLLFRKTTFKKFPKTAENLMTLSGTIDNETMLLLNAQAELDGHSFSLIAQEFLGLKKGHESDFWKLTKQHLFLVFASLIPAIFLGIFLSVVAYMYPPFRHLILSTVSLLQTIPSLGLLALLIPLLKSIGTLPALIALSLYALLPIVRNTYTGLQDIPKSLHESAEALGLPRLTRLFKIELPLAFSSLLSGIKIAAVYNVGVATIAAFVGAGGYGEKIIEGLALNDNKKLLEGAIPASLLAILIQQIFDLFHNKLLPKGLRNK